MESVKTLSRGFTVTVLWCRASQINGYLYWAVRLICNSPSSHSRLSRTLCVRDLQDSAGARWRRQLSTPSRAVVTASSTSASCRRRWTRAARRCCRWASRDVVRWAWRHTHTHRSSCNKVVPGIYGRFFSLILMWFYWSDVQFHSYLSVVAYKIPITY